jgi:hypothetical protein
MKETFLKTFIVSQCRFQENSSNKEREKVIEKDMNEIMDRYKR